jgi:hypothetical protein
VTAGQIIRLLSNVRSRTADRWIARCPAHQDRSPSLTIRQTHDLVLIHCFAGCSATDICAALGITLADLYHDPRRSRSRTHQTAERRCQAAESLETWRQTELRRCAEELRARDTLGGAMTRMVQADEITEDESWNLLAYVYHGYSELEHRFVQLLRGQDTLQLWRESRRAS